MKNIHSNKTNTGAIELQVLNKKISSKTWYLFLLFIVPFLLGAQVKISVSNGNWGTASTWSPTGVPSTSDKVKIYHTVTLNQTVLTSDTIFVYNTLNLGSGKTLILFPGKMILVNDNVYDGRIGSVGSGANIIGSFTFQKWLTRCDGSSTYGSPFDAQTSSFDWYYCYQCQTNWSNLYYYDESVTGVYDNGYYDNIGGNISRGKGFFYWYSNYAGGQNFPRKISLNGSLNFTNEFDFNVSYTSSNGGSSNDGYNLVSNPYPGTIDWLSGSWTRQNVSGTYYTWNSCTGTYASYSSGVGVNGGTRYIPSMQGFWVKAGSSSPSLKIQSGAMVANSQAMLKQSAHDDSVNFVLRMTLENDEVAIRLDAASTGSLDNTTDSPKFFSPDSKICTSTQVSGLDYAINAVELGDQVIPVKVKGGGTLYFSGITTFFDKYSIYLKDLLNKNYLPITEGMQYEFSDTSVVSFNERFEIHFKEKSIDTGIKTLYSESIKVAITNENMIIQVPKEMQSDINVKIFDLLGRELFSGTYNQSEIVLTKLNTPVLLRVYDKNYSFTKKIM